MRAHKWLGLLGVLLLAPACGDSGDGGGAGSGGTAAGGSGAGGSAGQGAGGSGGRDASANPGRDGAVADTVTSDAPGTDSAGGPDLAPGDAPVSDAANPSGCPGADSYVGDSTWKHHLATTAATRYCLNWRLGLTLKDELARKAMVSVAPGNYPLIDRAGTAAFALPFCLQRAGRPPVATTTGTVTMTSPVAGNQRFEFRQSLAGEPGNLHGQLSADVPASGVLTVKLDGERPGPDDGIRFILDICTNANCGVGDQSYFDSCTYTGRTSQLHTVAFEGGNAEFEMLFDDRFVTVGIEPAAYVRARGTLQGTAFDQRDYFKLIYSPTTNHHFIRHFAVLFDAPIGGACGLELEGVSGGINATPHVYTVTCTLDRIAELKITSGPTISR